MSDIRRGIEDSRGDPRVLLVLNLVLSVAFAALVISLASIVDFTTFTWTRVLAFAAVIFVLTYFVTH